MKFWNGFTEFFNNEITGNIVAFALVLLVYLCILYYFVEIRGQK
jgi:hypothetical protein